jgi:hypothetical protein
METLKLEEKHYGNVIDQMLKLKSRINYHITEIVPNLSSMYSYEEKEYIVIYNSCLAELKFLKNLIIEHEAIFNEILTCYNLSVSVFINKYILR